MSLLSDRRPNRVNRCPARLSLLTLALATASASASATDTDTIRVQEPDTGRTELETLVINAYRPAQTIGGATKTDTPLLETPHSVSVIERQELDARGVQNLNEAARYTSGVLPESQGIDNRVDDLYIRGFDAGSFGNNVMLDGMRAPSDSNLSWNRTAFNSWNLERVEILKGPSSVLYGQIAPGGMVNQVSKTPTLDQEHILQLQADSHGRYQTAFDTGGASDDRNSLWRLVGLIKDGGTQIDDTEHQQWFLAPSASFRLNDDNTRLTLLGLYQQDAGGSTFQFMPYQGSVIPGANGYIDNSTFLGEPDWNQYDRNIWSAGWLFEHQFNDDWRLRQSARHTHVDSLYRTTVGYGVRGAALTDLNTLTDGHILKRRAVQGEGDSDGQTLDTRIEGRFSTAALNHQLLAGVDWQKTDWDFLRKAAQVAPDAIQIDIYNPEYTYYDFSKVLFDQMSTKETDRQTGVYLQDQIALNNWRFTLGGRYDWFEIDSLNRLNGVTTRTEDEALTARAGVTYLFDNGFAPYLSYAESFQPAVGTSRSGAAFDPITGSQWEIGVKYEPSQIDGMITLAAYDLRQQNVLTADPLNQADERYQVQTGEVQIRGLELEGRITPFAGFSLIGAATRFDSEVTRNNDGYTGNRMIRVPDWMASLWLDYTFLGGSLDGLSLAAGSRYVDETYGNLANSLKIPSYTLYDAAVRYDLGQVGNSRVQLSLNASNLTNERYVATCTAATACYYGSGRTVMATARFSW